MGTGSVWLLVRYYIPRASHKYVYETMGAVNTQIEVDAKARLNFVVGPFVL